MSERDSRKVRHKTATEMGLPSRQGERAQGLSGPVRVRTSPRGVPLTSASAVPAELLPIYSDGTVQELRDYMDSETPPPFDTHTGFVREPTAKEAWDHANHVRQRMASGLAQIAEASGVGMNVRGEIERVGARTELMNQRVGDVADTILKKYKILRNVFVAVIIPLAGFVIWMVTKIYANGYNQGLADSWKTTMEMRIHHLEERR